MSKDFKPLIEKLQHYATELTAALVIVLLESQNYKPLKTELKNYLQKHPNLRHSNYLEIISLAYGFKDYNHLSAYLNEHRSSSMTELAARYKNVESRFIDNSIESGQFPAFYKALSLKDLSLVKKELTDDVIYDRKGINLIFALDYLKELGDPYFDIFKLILDCFEKAVKVNPEMDHNFNTMCSNMMNSLKYDYQCKIAQELLNDSNYESNVESSALINSIDNNSMDMLKVLLKSKINPNEKHYVMGYAISRSITNHSYSMVSLLLRYGAEFQEGDLFHSFFTDNALGEVPKPEALKFTQWLFKQMPPANKKSQLASLKVSRPDFIHYFDHGDA